MDIYGFPQGFPSEVIYGIPSGFPSEWDLPPRSLTANATEKLPGPNRKVIFQLPFFRGYVKLRGCNL